MYENQVWDNSSGSHIIIKILDLLKQFFSLIVIQIGVLQLLCSLHHIKKLKFPYMIFWCHVFCIMRIQIFVLPTLCTYTAVSYYLHNDCFLYLCPYLFNNVFSDGYFICRSTFEKTLFTIITLTIFEELINIILIILEWEILEYIRIFVG